MEKRKRPALPLDAPPQEKYDNFILTYFEAGYALGRGLKVIYTCRRDDHENVHFDLKTIQTILYDTPEELREALSLKIQAFIMD